MKRKKDAHNDCRPAVRESAYSADTTVAAPGDSARSGADLLEHLDHGAGTDGARIFLADRFPDQRPVFIEHEYRCRRQAVAMQVEHAILPRNRRVAVRVDDRERRNEILDRDIGASQIIGADGNDLGILRNYALVIPCQIDELEAAKRSPERPVEDQHGAPIAADLG